MRGEEKYRMILNAAKQVFAMEGFYNSKVSEIAREPTWLTDHISLF
jgi:AcrR family transcriptional regulator